MKKDKLDSLYFEYGETEIEWLKSRDPQLGAAIDEIGHIQREIIPDLFAAMVNSIIGQQISAKAQVTIWGRVAGKFKPLTPAAIASAAEEDLRACGITTRRALCIKEIAQSILDGSLDLTELYNLSDEEVCKRLVKIKGIGTWTAEMLMIFSMQRKDILSWGDLAIHRGLRILYRHRKITPKLFNKYKRRYSPYASVASLYLWALSKTE
ncbi:MAG: DNA-3-methyladenine glycosylase 2 family protein [Spirochaetes bacterium]|nr:DNA-3-methyladenine glycosylase 2 family protein [Spirochaetota bacterium]